jgi:hypothetical protein
MKTLATNWLRRAVSTLVMMSVFFVAFSGGFSIFLSNDYLKGFLALTYVAIGLVVSRLLWV